MPVNQLCLCAVEEMTCQENERENSKLTSVFNDVPSKIHFIKNLEVKYSQREENLESTWKSCSALLQV